MRAGFQTEGNLFDGSSEAVMVLESAILQELKQYYKSFESHKVDLISRWPKKTMLTGWYVKLKQGGHQNFHLHPGGWVSGVIYLKTINNPVGNEGSLELSEEGYIDSKKESRPSGYLHQPSVGDIVLFPSSLPHRTIPVKQDADRNVIAFDVLGEPDFDESSLAGYKL